MDQGITLPVSDFVEVASSSYTWYDWGGYGGSSSDYGRHLEAGLCSSFCTILQRIGWVVNIQLSF